MIGLWLLKRHVDNVDDLMATLRSLPTTPATGSTLPPGEITPPVEQPPVDQPVLPSGDIVTRYGSPPQDVADAIKRHWPQAQWVNAATVSYLESGWRNTAELNTLNRGPCGTRYWFSDAVGWATTEDSIGIFQINICAHGGTKETWYSADNNARKGAELYASNGWYPWVISARRAGLL